MEHVEGTDSPSFETAEAYAKTMAPEDLDLAYALQAATKRSWERVERKIHLID